MVLTRSANGDVYLRLFAGGGPGVVVKLGGVVL